MYEESIEEIVEEQIDESTNVLFNETVTKPEETVLEEK